MSKSQTNEIKQFLDKFQHDKQTTSKFLDFCQRINVQSQTELEKYFLAADQESLESSGFTACIKRFPRTRILKELLGEHFHGVQNNLVIPAEESLHTRAKRVPVIWLGVLLEPRSLDDEMIPTLEERQEIEEWAKTDLKHFGFPGVSLHEIRPPKYEWMIFSGPKREIERLHESLEDLDSPLRQGRLFSLAEQDPGSCKILPNKPSTRSSEEQTKDTFGFGRVSSDMEENTRMTKSLENYGIATQNDLNEFLKFCFDEKDWVFLRHFKSILRVKRDQAFLEEYHKLSGTDVKMFNVTDRLKSLEEETNKKFSSGDFAGCAPLQPQINRLKSVVEIRELAEIDINAPVISPPVAGKRPVRENAETKHDIDDLEDKPTTSTATSRKKSKNEPKFKTETVGGIKFRLDSTKRTINILKFLSKTIHGCVYGGIIKKSGKLVALKFSDKENVIRYANTQPHLENVFEEIKIHHFLTQNCETPYIIGLHDFFLDNRNIVCVQDFASDGDLFDYCMNRMPKDTAKREQLSKDLFRQIIEAVRTLHKNFIAHNDISLENILLHRTRSKKIYIKIIDFGMSKGGPDSAFARGNWRVKLPSPNGKKNYRSPEVWELNYDARANDIHCIGCCLFSMLTLTQLYSKTSPRFDRSARFVQSGRLAEVLRARSINYLSRNAVDILQKMLLPEDQRITMEGLSSHAWLKS